MAGRPCFTGKEASELVDSPPLQEHASPAATPLIVLLGLCTI